MRAYKLVRLCKDIELAPLFINRKESFKMNEWMVADCFPTKGFAVRKGFHCCLTPYAPHLNEELSNGEQRVWVEVEVSNFEKYSRPESQGGTWVLAQKMKINKVVSKEEIKIILKQKRAEQLVDACLEWISEVINDKEEFLEILDEIGFNETDLAWYNIDIKEED